MSQEHQAQSVARDNVVGDYYWRRIFYLEYHELLCMFWDTKLKPPGWSVNLLKRKVLQNYFAGPKPHDCDLDGLLSDAAEPYHMTLVVAKKCLEAALYEIDYRYDRWLLAERLEKGSGDYSISILPIKPHYVRLLSEAEFIFITELVDPGALSQYSEISGLGPAGLENIEQALRLPEIQSRIEGHGEGEDDDR